MSVITGSDATAFVTAADVAADGEATDAASVRVAIEALLDCAASLVSRVITWSPSTGSAGEFGQKVNLNEPLYNTNNRFGAYFDAGATPPTPLGWMQTDTADGGSLAWQVIPPHAGAILATVRARVDGGAGAGHGILNPASKPTLWAIRVVDGALGHVSSVTDSAVLPGYDSPHNIEVTCNPLNFPPVAHGATFWVVFNGESGANAVNSTTALLDITCTWTNEPAP